MDNGQLWLRALVGNHHTGEAIKAEARGDLQSPEAIAAQVVQSLREQGAENILKAVLG